MIRRCTMVAAGLVAFTLATGARSEAQILSVPGDYPTIQMAIDAAPNGAVISVGRGVYVENLDFLGKAITLEGAGPDSVIHGAGLGPVVRFVSGEGPASVLDSFTIRGGLAPMGGGIEIVDSSPVVVRNVIRENSATGVGSGIYIGGSSSSPQIFNNLLIFNTGVSGGDPHTIQVASSSPRIVNNTIVRNDSNAILTSGGGFPEIRNNILARNGTRFTGAGRKGRGICDFTPGTITQYNLFFRNVVAALLTSGTDFRRIRRAQKVLQRERLAFNRDGAPRFSGGRIPSDPEVATTDRFLPREGPVRTSPAVHGGDPDPAYDNLDGSRNTLGFTGGPYAPTSF